MKECLVFLEVLDTAGQDTFVAMRELYMRNGEGFALIFSITSVKSLMELEEIRKGICKVQGDDIPLVLVANKIDLESQRKVDNEQIKAVATNWNRPHLMVSAKENINISAIFESLIQQQWDRSGGPPINKPGRTWTCTLL